MRTLQLPETVDHPKGVAAAVDRGNAAFMVDDLTSAEASFREAASLASDAAVPAFNLGVARYQLGHVDEGKRAMDRGIALIREGGGDGETLERMLDIRKILHGPDNDSPIGGSPSDTRPS